MLRSLMLSVNRTHSIRLVFAFRLGTRLFCLDRVPSCIVRSCTFAISHLLRGDYNETDLISSDHHRDIGMGDRSLPNDPRSGTLGFS